jgi:hypothetical protein
MNHYHEGYTLKSGACCNIYKASRMYVHLDATLHCTTAFGEAKSLARAL